MDPYENSKINTKRYKKLKTLLESIYGFSEFKPKQYEIINRIVSGEDVCAVLPTGYGKSLTFQIAALYLDKPAIIISPLISLMDDQRLILDELGVSSCCFNSTVKNRSSMKRDIMQRKYKFIYITPESLVNMKEFLIKLEDLQGISLIAIDEAHCISSYGFDFRKAYRQLTCLKETLKDVPILAVTATATKVVAKDICKVLSLNTKTVIKTSFDRPNLYLEVRLKHGKDIAKDILPIIKAHPSESVIIYCLTKKETANIKSSLKAVGVTAGIYHAGLDTDEKEEAHKDFLSGKISVIVATIAFGMGINKSNVRVVIHYGSPKNIEGYYQEIGRAGRDGAKACCYALYSKADFEMQKSFIHSGGNEAYREVQMELLDQMKRYITSKGCRRAILLEYFGDEVGDNCGNCDNCCGTHLQAVTKPTTLIDIKSEAKLLIDLIESIPNRNFGTGMYINILRGSTVKTITPDLRKNKYFGSGSKKSVAWWKEMIDHLIDLGFIQQVFIRGKFGIKIIKVTSQGIKWANQADLTELLGVTADSLKLEPVAMMITA